MTIPINGTIPSHTLAIEYYINETDAKEYRKTRIPGGFDFTVNEVTADDKETVEYKAWKSGDTSPLVTPLSAWPALNKQAIKDLEYQGFTNVEQLANMGDAYRGSLHYSRKRGAAEFLAARQRKAQ